MVGIYKIENVINNKKYIGSTNKSFELRKKQHFNALKNNRHENPKLQNAFNKYGIDFFKFEIIISFEEIKTEELLKLEETLINENKVLCDDFGYNLCKVSNSRLGTKWNNESKNKRKGVNNPMYGKGYERLGNKNPMFGKHISLENKIKTSLLHKGLKKPSVSKKLSKPVIQLDLMGHKIKEYVSITEAEYKTNIRHISCVCNSKRKTAGGFKWKYKNE